MYHYVILVIMSNAYLFFPGLEIGGGGLGGLNPESKFQK